MVLCIIEIRKKSSIEWCKALTPSYRSYRIADWRYIERSSEHTYNGPVSMVDGTHSGRSSAQTCLESLGLWLLLLLDELVELEVFFPQNRSPRILPQLFR